MSPMNPGSPYKRTYSTSKSSTSAAAKSCASMTLTSSNCAPTAIPSCASPKSMLVSRARCAACSMVLFLPPSMIRRLQSVLPQSTIRWEFVNLVEPDPLRRVKLRITHEKLEDLHPADLAAIMEDLSAAERQGIIASLDEQTA